MRFWRKKRLDCNELAGLLMEGLIEKVEAGVEQVATDPLFSTTENDADQAAANANGQEEWDARVRLEVVAWTFSLLAYATFTTKLERGSELLLAITSRLWAHVCLQQGSVGDQDAFQRFLDSRMVNYIKLLQDEDDPTVKVADTLLKNLSPQPAPSLLCYFAATTGSYASINIEMLDKFEERFRIV